MNLLSGVEQDFHRPQKSPGAYEWWHFDGLDDHSGYSFSAQFYAGNPLSPFYQQTLKRYLQETQSPLVKSPTAAPPQPLDFCGVVFRVFKKGALVDEFLQEFTPGQLKASEEQAALLLGPNRFHFDAAGDPPGYTVTLQGKVSKDRSLRARFFFIPEMTPPFPMESIESLPTHSWVLAAPRCRVEGTLQWCDPEGEVLSEIPWAGFGYHDHHFGTVPLDRFLRAWHWGHAFLGSKTVIYSYQEPLAADEKPKGLWMTLDKAEFKVWDAAFEPSKKRWNFFALPYVKALGFTDFDAFKVLHRTILSDGPASLMFEDEVTWEKDGAALTAVGLSQYLYPPRFSSSLFYPMLKGKTQILSKPTENTPRPGGDVTTERPELRS
jgi:carotenoid 1,2-hydratase